MSAKEFITRQWEKLTDLFSSGLSLKFQGAGTDKRLVYYGIGITLLFMVLHIYSPRLLTFLENKLYDTFHTSIEHPARSNIVIVDIDEQSLKRLGQWPWPRYQMAKMFKKITDAGASAIGVDILFPEPDRTSPSWIKKDIKAELGLDLYIENIPEYFRSNDRLLAKIFREGNFALGYKFFDSDDGKKPKASIPLNIVVVKDKSYKQKNHGLHMAKTATEPLPILAKAMGGAGFVNVRPDIDGVIRKVPVMAGFEEKIYPSLALATLMRAENIEQAMLKISASGEKTLSFGETKIPLDPKGNLLIRYRGPKNSFPYISASDLITDKIDKDKLKDKIVFVGTSATGLKDSYTIPLDTLFPGVEVHANVVDNILNNKFLSQPSWFRGMEIIITLACGLLVSLILAYAPPLASLLFPALCLSGLWFGTIHALKNYDVFFSPLYPLLTVVGCFAFLSLMRFRSAEQETQKKQREIQQFESELNVAREIQMGVVPKEFPPFPDQDNFELAAMLTPAREVGGDLYDYFFIDDNKLCFTIGDVSGKGVPASLFMVITRTLIKNLAGSYDSPADLMTRVNEALCIDNPRSLFVTLFIGILDTRTGELKYANGGHNPPVEFTGENKVLFNLDSSGPVVGVIDGLPYSEHSLFMSQGDAIFLYTDGVTEAMDMNRNEFSNDKLLAICKTLGNESASQVIKTVHREVKKHAGRAPQSDDIAMVMLRFLKQKP